MSRYALLAGDAPIDFRQRKLVALHDALEADGSYAPGNVVVFPNGTAELLLEAALGNIFDQEPEQVLLYFCTKEPVKESAGSLYLGGEEIRKDVIAYYRELSRKLGAEMQVVYDSDREFVSEASLGYEKV